MGSRFLGLGVEAAGFLGLDVSGCRVSVQGFWVRVPAFRVPGFPRVCGVKISEFECSGFRAGPHPLVLMLPAPSLIVRANKREAGSGHYCDNAGHARKLRFCNIVVPDQALYFAISGVLGSEGSKL